MYTSWEFWRGRNVLLFENNPFMLEKVAKCATLAMKEFGLINGELVIPPSHDESFMDLLMLFLNCKCRDGLCQSFHQRLL